MWRMKCFWIMPFICHIKESDSISYRFIFEPTTWHHAQEYCNAKNYHLASVSNSDVNRATTDQEYPVWMGLQTDGETLRWTTGFTNYSNLNSTELGDSSGCVSINSTTKKMATQDCNSLFTFLCITENVVMVNESKTWEEALGHCRALKMNLLSIQPSDDRSYLISKMFEANTEEIWTGLRFLAGEWLWVTGADMLYTKLPTCPILGHYCGAIFKSDLDKLENRDCLEKKNFLCYKPM